LCVFVFEIQNKLDNRVGTVQIVLINVENDIKSNTFEHVNAIGTGDFIADPIFMSIETRKKNREI